MVFPPIDKLDSADRPMRWAASDEAPQAPGASPRDAESGNTASQTCTGKQDEDLFQVVWQGIDTLELTYAGQINPNVEEELSRLKELARSQEQRYQALAQYAVGERAFEVSDKNGGRFFAYLLLHADMRLVLSSTKAKRIPLACVTLSNRFLVAVGPEAAEAAARSVVESLGTVDGPELVKRVDVTADIATDVDLGMCRVDAWITRAEHIEQHHEAFRFSGWSIGRGAEISGRFYDKKLEIAKSGKLYFLDLWAANGWFPADPILRAEFQFRRAALHRFGLKTRSDVLDALPALWTYATNDWLRLAIPNAADATRSRWGLDPFWQRVQAIPWSGGISSLDRKQPSTNAPSDKMLARMFKAVAVAVMARNGLPTLREASDKLSSLLMAEFQRIEQWEGASPDQMLSEAVMFKRRKYGLPIKA